MEEIDAHEYSSGKVWQMEPSSISTPTPTITTSNSASSSLSPSHLIPPTTSPTKLISTSPPSSSHLTTLTTMLSSDPLLPTPLPPLTSNAHSPSPSSSSNSFSTSTSTSSASPTELATAVLTTSIPQLYPNTHPTTPTTSRSTQPTSMPQTTSTSLHAIESLKDTLEQPSFTSTTIDPSFVERNTLTTFNLNLYPIPYQTQISDPLKQGEGLKDAYVSYLITSKDMEQGVIYQVRRRFTDFVWLHYQLTAVYPECIVCPIPDKHRMEYITGDRFSSEFVEKRRSSLNRFLNRIIRHPVLQKSSDLYHFLTSSNWSLDQMKPPKKDGVFENLSETILNAFSKLKHPDPKFLDLKEQVTRLEDHLQNLEKYYMKMIKKHLELEHDYAEFGAGLTSLGVLEAPITSAMTEVGAQLYAFAKNLHERAHHEDVHLCAQLRDYLNYCHIVKYALKLRDHKQLDYEVLVEAYHQHQLEKQKLEFKDPQVGTSYTLSGYLKGKYEEITGVDQERSRQDRIQKIEFKCTQLEQEIQQAKHQSTLFSENIAKEIDYFQATRSIDFRDIFLEYTNHQIQFFQKGLKQWESVLPILDQIRVEDDN